MCNCTGEITYSPELFDGYVYTVPEEEQAYKVSWAGLIRENGSISYFFVNI